MFKKTTTRKALLLSAVGIVLCFAMLLGTTYAWFTDSVAAKGNIIKSGTLNIDLALKTGDDADYVSVKENPTKKAFDYQLWEPGYTEWVNAKVYTTGNLALKYTMKLEAEGEVSELADVIDVYYAPVEIAKPATRSLNGLTKLGTLAQALRGEFVINDTLIPGSNEEDFATLALHMQEDAGNDYQNMEIGAEFAFKILATQYTYEKDAFDDQYDADAEWPGVVRVDGAEGLGDALADAQGKESTIKLTEDIADATGLITTAGTNLTVDLNGHTLAIATPVGSRGTETLGAQLLKGSKAAIENGTFAAASDNVKLLVQNYTDLKLKDVTLDGTTSANMLYVLSCNYGTTVISGNTNIKAPAGQVALDVMDWNNAAYGDAGVKVIIDETMTGIVDGIIDVYQYPANSNPNTQAELIIKGGTFRNTGLTLAQFQEFVAEGYVVNEVGGDYVVTHA